MRGCHLGLVVGLLAFFLLSLCTASVFVGIQKNIESISYGLLDTKTGASTIKSTFNLVTFNAPQFAYSSNTEQYTFIAYDSSTYDSVWLTLNATSGEVVYNSTFQGLPIPFGLQYDNGMGTLYGQAWYANGSCALVALSVKQAGLLLGVGFVFDNSDLWWSFVASNYDPYGHVYYSLYVSPASQILVGITVFNGLVVSNLTLNLDTSLGAAYGLQYNNNTDTFYVIGFNNITLNYDLATINQANGSLSYLNLFTNSTLGDVVGMGMDTTNNQLLLVSSVGYDLILATVDLKALSIGYTKLAGNSISSMLALSNLQ